jgi:FAD/FMN-containing dehydrogenase
MTAVPSAPDVVDLLHRELDGRVVTDQDDDYGQLRRIWNHDIDRRPRAIVQAETVADVQTVVRAASEFTGLLAVRGGGHSFGGHSTVDDGIVLDLSRMRGVSIDPSVRRATVQGGCLLGDLDRASQVHGLVTPAGVVSHTGVAGLTLGGGYGYLSRRLALSCDSLRAVDLVTADGELRRVDDDTDPELMWGVRGGGGNFGVVTSFEFDSHEQGDVLTGWLVYPFEIVEEFLAHYMDVVTNAPEDLCLPIRLLVPSTSPIIPEELRDSGRHFIGMRFVWGGDHAAGYAMMEELKAWRPPVVDSVDETAYVALQSSIDVTSRHGLGRYAKAGYMMSIQPEMVAGMVELQLRAPSELCEIVFFPLGGAVSRVGEDATAYSSRAATFMYEVRTAWTDPGERDAVVAWTRETWEFLDQFAMDGVYVNLLTPGEERVRKSYGEAKYARLGQLKARVDPDNLFRLNQNIPPALG